MALKILLIYPYFLEQRIQPEEISSPPLGIYYVGAMLRAQGFDVEILNWSQIHHSLDRARQVLRKKAPRIVGISMLHANRLGAVRIARLVKEVDPKTTVVMGGVGATFLWKHLLLNFQDIDFVLTGEAEYSFLELARLLERGDEEGVGKIKGIAMRKNGVPCLVPQSPPIQDLDSLPDPARFFKFHHVVSSRGCPWACTFCGSPRFWGRRLRFHSPRYFVDQLEVLHNKGISHFLVSDDTFTFKKDRVIQICQEITKRGLAITWQAISRVSHVDQEILYWMRKAGCIQISYGVESGSPEIRRRLNKRLRQEDIERAFSLTRSYGIMPRAYFIYGSPGETKKSIMESVDLIRKIKPLSAIFYILDIFPGTQLYDEFKKRSGLNDDIWLQPLEDIMYFQTDPRLTAEMVLEFGKMLREAFYGGLPEFAQALELVDKEELYPLHADFLSRLGLTFSHGDYSQNPLVPRPQETAERLFLRALHYHPDHRAYLGLGILYQKRGAHQETVRLLEEAICHHPQSEELHMCLAVSHMNLGQISRAIELLQRFPGSREATQYLAHCYSTLGLQDKARECLNRLAQWEE